MQAAGNALGAEMSDLRNYIIAGLLWDPARSGRKLMDEFLTLHYGPAGLPIRRFLRFTHDHAQASGKHRLCFAHAEHYAIDEAVVAAGLEAFAEALKLADSPARRARVEKASICVHRAAVEDAWRWVIRNRKNLGSKRFAPAKDSGMRARLKRLFALCRKHNVTHWAEGTTVPKAETLLKRALGLSPDASW